MPRQELEVIQRMDPQLGFSESYERSQDMRLWPVTKAPNGFNLYRMDAEEQEATRSLGRLYSHRVVRSTHALRGGVAVHAPSRKRPHLLSRARAQCNGLAAKTAAA